MIERPRYYLVEGHEQIEEKIGEGLGASPRHELQKPARFPVEVSPRAKEPQTLFEGFSIGFRCYVLSCGMVSC